MPKSSFGNSDILELIRDRANRLQGHDNDSTMWENLKAIKSLCEVMLD